MRLKQRKNEIKTQFSMLLYVLSASLCPSFSSKKKFTITLKYDYFSLFFLLSFFQHNLYIFRCLNAFIMIASSLSLSFYFSLSNFELQEVFKKSEKNTRKKFFTNDAFVLPLSSFFIAHLIIPHHQKIYRAQRELS